MVLLHSKVKFGLNDWHAITGINKIFFSPLAFFLPISNKFWGREILGITEIFPFALSFLLFLAILLIKCLIIFTMSCKKNLTVSEALKLFDNLEEDYISNEANNLVLNGEEETDSEESENEEIENECLVSPSNFLYW